MYAACFLLFLLSDCYPFLYCSSRCVVFLKKNVSLSQDDGSWVPLAVSIQSIKQRSSAATGSAGSSRDSRVGSRAGSRSSSRATSPQGQRPGTSVLGSFDSHETTRTPATRLSFHSNIGGSVSLSCIGSDHFPFEVGMDDIIYVIGRTEVEDVFLGYTSILQVRSPIYWR